MPGKKSKIKKISQKLKGKGLPFASMELKDKEMKGEGVGDWISSAYNWVKDKAIPTLKEGKYISRISKVAGHLGVPYARSFGDFADSYGFGVKQMRGKGTSQMMT